MNKSAQQFGGTFLPYSFSSIRNHLFNLSLKRFIIKKALIPLKFSSLLIGCKRLRALHNAPTPNLLLPISFLCSFLSSVFIFFLFFFSTEYLAFLFVIFGTIATNDLITTGDLHCLSGRAVESAGWVCLVFNHCWRILCKWYDSYAFTYLSMQLSKTCAPFLQCPSSFNSQRARKENYKGGI